MSGSGSQSPTAGDDGAGRAVEAAPDTPPPEPIAWHSRPLEDVFSELGTSADGLPNDTAAARLDAVGPNELTSSSG